MLSAFGLVCPIGAGATLPVIPITATLSLPLAQTNSNPGSTCSTGDLKAKPSQSGDTLSVTAHAEEDMRVIGAGMGTLMAANGAPQLPATFESEDQADSLHPQDLTPYVRIIQSGLRFDRHSGLFVQTVRLSNRLSLPIDGPMYFVATDLPSAVMLVDSGRTQNIEPQGSPYSELDLPGGMTFQPGASLTLTLQFLDAKGTPITYIPKVFRTPGAP
jgi:hypothetical protein